MRELVKVPSKLLRQKSKPVKTVDSEIKSLARELVQFIQLHRADNIRPLSLSACQLGELVRVIAFKRNPVSLDEDDIQVLINPTLAYAKGFHLVTESCLSIPGKAFTLRRAKIVKIRGLTLDGVERSFRARDLLAEVFQHELNHLDGILIDQIEKGNRYAKASQSSRGNRQCEAKVVASRGGAVEARQDHDLEIGGLNPPPATKSIPERILGGEDEYKEVF